MFTKKDRKIANQEAMIKNRDKLIKDLSNKKDELMKENIAVYQENKEMRYEKEELIDIVKDILKLAEGNTYNNDKIVLRKIKELAKTAIQD